jgi:hypothetical protein
MRDATDTYEGQALAYGPAGSIIIFNGSVWHGHTANRSARRRRSIRAPLSHGRLDRRPTRPRVFVPRLSNASEISSSAGRPPVRRPCAPLPWSLAGWHSANVIPHAGPSPLAVSRPLRGAKSALRPGPCRKSPDGRYTEAGDKTCLMTPVRVCGGRWCAGLQGSGRVARPERPVACERRS